MDILNLIKKNLYEENFNIFINISEGDSDRYASLDLDIIALQQVLFVSRISEILYCYILYLSENDAYKNICSENEIKTLEAFLLQDDEAMFSSLLIMEMPSLFGFSGLGINRIRPHQKRIASSLEIFRLELVGVTKNSPTKLMIHYAGSGAMMVLLTFCGIVVHKSISEDSNFKSSKSDMVHLQEIVLEIAKREGKATKYHDEAMKNINKAFEISVKASAAKITGDVVIEEKGISISVNN